MAQDVNLQQEILQKTLEEVSQDGDHGGASPCVICLEHIEEVGIALPCKHQSFDFICLVSWLGERPSCPLCQATVTGVKYGLHSPQGPKIYPLSPPSEPSRNAPFTSAGLGRRRSPGQRGRLPRGPRRSSPRPQQSADDPIARRRQVYRRQLYSQRVGTNRLSQYREITPQIFDRDEDLVSRARKWIRRELQVFEFLNADNDTANEGDAVSGTARRRANNAEFLLEYIIAILRTVDIKGSGGQAEELLQEFIGRDNARLFLHELQAWLRSPYNSLEDWDRSVQYDERGERLPPAVNNTTGDRTEPNRLNSGRARGSSRPHGIRKSRMPQRQPGASQWRRIQSARERYPAD